MTDDDDDDDDVDGEDDVDGSDRSLNIFTHMGIDRQMTQIHSEMELGVPRMMK
jgi:hypothetical protein